MLTLLHEPRAAEPLALQPPAERKSPGMAFALALLFPGLGHAYLRRWKIAAWTAAGFLFSLACIASDAPALFGLFLVGVPALYIFSAADAFHAAREWNAGVEGRLIGANPRVATLLNLLTRGFGYFYLGQRAKGIAVIVVMTVIYPFLLSPWLRLVAIMLQVAIAADGYRVARNQLLEANPELALLTAATGSAEGTAAEAGGGDPDPVRTANAGTLSPAIVSVALTLLGGTALFALFAFQLIQGRSNHAPGTVDVGEGGLQYRNAALGIELKAPEGWDTQPSGDTLLSIRNGSCAFTVIDNTILHATTMFLSGIRTGILKTHPEATFGSDANWGGHGEIPHSMSISMMVRGKAVHENWFGLRHGTHLTSLLETYPVENTTCAAQYHQIENSVAVR